jgi:TubC N-terminal docking domain
MTAIETLQALCPHGVEVTLCGDRLALRAPQALPEDVLEALEGMKPEIIAILRASFRPAGYSDDVWLAAVLDAARLGYRVHLPDRERAQL